MNFNFLKIAHIILDEKFSDSAYELFESIAPNCNDFFIASNPHKLKYIKKVPVKFVGDRAYSESAFIKKIKKYDFVVLHALTDFNQRLVLNSRPSNTKFVWIGMGYDYYDLIVDNNEELLLNKTRQVLRKHNRELYEGPLWKYFLKYKLPYLDTLRQNYFRTLKIKAIKKIHFFSPVLENEYTLVKEKFDGKFPLYVPWNYSTNSSDIDDASEAENTLHGDNLLLGNSASETNNHIEMIDLLSEIALDGRKLICPLNYGIKKYADIVIEYATQKLGSRFVPILDFIPFDEYMNLISNCSTVLMNHRRQQATGNIVAMLTRGAEVFVRDENPVYEFYSSKGLKIFKIQDIEKNSLALFQKLESKSIYENKKIIKQLYGMENSLLKTQNLIDTVMSTTGQK